MGNKIIKRDSLSKQVSDKLEAMIDAGTYQVGDRFPTEPELMEMFEVSRNTVREAVQSLTWAGLLEVKQGDGTYVRASNRFYANMNQRCSHVSLDDIKETRNCLETTIAKLSAQRRTEEDIQIIEHALHHRKNLSTDIKENTKADLEFHMAIAEASHNDILIDVYKSISTYLESQIAERMESPYSPLEIDLMHEVLFEAIRDGEPEQAESAALRIVEI